MRYKSDFSGMFKHHVESEKGQSILFGHLSIVCGRDTAKSQFGLFVCFCQADVMKRATLTGISPFDLVGKRAEGKLTWMVSVLF